MNPVIFVYAKDGRVKCLCQREAMEAKLPLEGWKHTATIDPAAWIEHLMNDGLDPSDVMDELNFGPSCTPSPSA